MLSGIDVTRFERPAILSIAASWVGLAIDDVEFHETIEGAFAILIYVTIDREKQDISENGIVMFADDETEPVVTGQHAELHGIWIFAVPEGGVFVDDAHTEFIRVKKRE
ncbi:hypothetical protein HIM_11461 [Hirsutella minnesotensis 3608]|uniref:Uncharacterized protein n=1 Tax=Hirsutella minnesotensis 3608 TaxID=1043627 RepID=A0A0F7ZR79_9HYPO|nr:hypothetical protein HIM_11461 [Hirsutella minnesotensis 3608]